MTNLQDTPSSGKLTDADLDAAIRSSWPVRRARVHYSGPCDQGRKQCASPTDCELAEVDEDEDEDGLGAARGVVMALAITFFAFASAGLLAYLFRL